MSRLIVKNLPKSITESKLRELFSQKGIITDVQLKYTKDGVFRQFAFVGYQTDDDAQTAAKYFNSTYITTNRINVELCAALGDDESKPKTWSKHTVKVEKKTTKNDDKPKTNVKSVYDEIVGDHKNDPQFIEFMGAHTKPGRDIWTNDLGLEELTNENEAITSKKQLDKSSKKKEPVAEIAVEDDEAGKEECTEKSKKSLKKKSEKKDMVKMFHVKLRGIGYKTKRQDIIHFFKPIKAHSVRMPLNAKGFCYAGFKTEKEFQQALKKDRTFLKDKQIYVMDFNAGNDRTKADKDENPSPIRKNSKWAKQEEALCNEEDISESGKIYFRNLSYTVNENDMQKLFEEYGPVSEISVPIDTITRQIKGFGVVTFLMPEHAVMAFNKLDGTSFHGRLLHLLPAKTNSNDNKNDDDALNSMSFKNKKNALLKKSAGSSHNWNSLFMGANAVAEIMSETYGTSKETILDSNAGGSSAAVRLALGETQIVAEMKQFLEDNGVDLKAFDTGAKTIRSKTVILAKNLQTGTTVDEIQKMFAKFGHLNRVVFPPSGVTALIEFLDPSESKMAFKKLAYTKFKSLPLYLEWAPENCLIPGSKGEGKISKNDDKIDDERSKPITSQSAESKESIDDDETNSDKNDDGIDVDDEPAEPHTTIFLRNLNFTTRENVIRQHFKHIGPIHSIQVAMKKDADNPKSKTSLGYGFIQFKKHDDAEKALRTMSLTTIEFNKVELKRSDRLLSSDAAAKSTKKPSGIVKQNGTKMLIRNIPFQANHHEVRDIFKAFGELRSLRIPKKMTPGEETHRGFGFVDYVTKEDAKKAFDSLSQSTHLYGRRLVLEWAALEEGVQELRKRTADHFHKSTVTSKQPKGVFEHEATNDDDEK